MADLFQLSDLTVTDVDSPSSAGSGYNTGDLRRKYAFGNQVSELSISQDPFFRFVSMVNKRPTDDPAFKFTERRGSFHKRYGYVTGWGATEGAIAGTEATPTASLLDGVGDIIWVEMKTDYKSSGNIQGIIGQSDLTVGSAGTKPIFFMAGQLVKLPLVTTDGTNIDTAAEAFNVSDFVVGKVEEVNDSADTLAVNLKLTIIRPKTVTAVDWAGWGAATTANQALDGAANTVAVHATYGLHDGV